MPRIEAVEVRNYRALKQVSLRGKRGLRPLTVFLGPNGSGKSTLFDVFAFLSECFAGGLRKAWEKRGRFKELRTRGAEEPITITLKYREKPTGRYKSPVMTYKLAIDEDRDGPFVAEESLAWTRSHWAGRPFAFINMRCGKGEAISGEAPDQEDTRIPIELVDRESLAISTLGQFKDHPRVSALRRFITGWHLSYLTLELTRGTPESGAQEHLSQSGDNLANVMQYLQERHPDRLAQILNILTSRVPRLETVDPIVLPDGRLLLRLKDVPFEEPILAKYASDGTMKMLAYLTVLYDPDPRPLVGIEEPENHLHPRLLPELCEECRKASGRSQLMITTHSPFFVNGLRPDELWVLYRDERGYTQAVCSETMRGISEYIEAGAQLGELWAEGYFDVGDPLVHSGGPKRHLKQ